MSKDKGKKEKKAKKAAERKEKPKAGKMKAAENSKKPKRQVTLYPESFEKTASPAPVPKTESNDNRISEEFVKKEFSAVPTQHRQSKKEPAKRPDDASAQEMLVIFQALADENRLKIMNLLSGRELSTPELLESVHIVQSTMSHHMKVLCEAGLVCSRKEGKRSCYSVRKDTLEQAAVYFESLRGK
ncbi:MAG: metalloregulator ArsR/SmtB family transcription factor [Lachnospiraceae bacterium]|nr:metalloregulator ArsR/SmtB family transcription factor [Lachnospiraceae bacterium]